MRNYRTHIMLAVLLVSLAVPVCTTFAKPKPRAVVDAGILAPALDVFPGTIYDNIYTRAAKDDGATGSFTVNQSSAEQFVVIQLSVDGLLPSTTYTVYLDTNGITAGDVSTVGPWTLTDTFTTDATGAADWYYQTSTLSSGTYCWSLFINKITYRPGTTRIATNYTILISDNLDFSMK
jgi:hypothetical protein